MHFIIKYADLSLGHQEGISVVIQGLPLPEELQMAHLTAFEFSISLW
jgi:hypothetical protein